MRFRALLFLLLPACLFAAGVPEYPAQGENIYDPEADGLQQVADAIHAARADQKHVLLQLGANWCVWCRRLDATLETNRPIQRLLKRHFVVARIDMNQRDGKKRNLPVNDRYGNPIEHGYPVLVVLDKEGHLLKVQETGSLEDGKDGHDPEKILAFLRRWAPPE